MIGATARLVERYGVWALLRLPLYPVTVLLTTPLRLVQTLWATRRLAAGRWSGYNMFCARKALNHLFYWTQAHNLDRYGRDGVSPVVGLGDFPLARWFHLTLASSYLNWRAGAVLPVGCMAGWVAMHLVWSGTAPDGWLGLVLATAVISTQFYAAAFGYLNYNAVGWVFFPLGLWGWLTGHHGIAAVAWLGVSFGSFTGVAVAAWLACFAALELQGGGPLWSVVPAGLKVATHFRWLAVGMGGMGDAALAIAKVIGLTRRATKYVRRRVPYGWVGVLYFLTLYAVFALGLWWSSGGVSLLWLGGVALYLVNATVARFSDPQNMHMTQFSVATALLLSAPDPLLLPFYWLVASPLPRAVTPFLFKDRPGNHSIDVFPPLSPFDIGPVLERVRGFLEPVAPGRRVLAAFDDPQGIYQNVFDGYRVLHEVPLYVACRRGVHLFPDWYAVMTTNYPGAPDFWGRDPEAVNENVRRWDADYVLVYQASDSELEPRWWDAGYRSVSSLDWGGLDGMLGYERPWHGPTPKWWLLEVPR